MRRPPVNASPASGGWPGARRGPAAAGGRGAGGMVDDEQNPQDIRELAAWLEADDARSRAMRAARLRDLLDILPVSSDGLSFLGGEQSVLCFDEIRRCYLDRSDMAVVLLCLAYVERELVAQLYAAGWEPCEEGSTGEGAGTGLRRRSAVGARVAHLRRAGASAQLVRPLPRARARRRPHPRARTGRAERPPSRPKTKTDSWLGSSRRTLSARNSLRRTRGARSRRWRGSSSGSPISAWHCLPPDE